MTPKVQKRRGLGELFGGRVVAWMLVSSPWGGIRLLRGEEQVGPPPALETGRRRQREGPATESVYTVIAPQGGASASEQKGVLERGGGSISLRARLGVRHTCVRYFSRAQKYRVLEPFTAGTSPHLAGTIIIPCLARRPVSAGSVRAPESVSYTWPVGRRQR